ncbi:MAG: tetratricopeptide repeat protein [Bacteroidales bacterium]
MKKNRLLVLIFGLYILNSCFASNQPKMLQAYLKGNWKYWKQQIDSLRTISNLSFEKNKQLALYEYEYIGYLLGKKQNEVASVYYPDAQKRITYILKKENSARFDAIMSAFIGYGIVLNPMKAPFAGPKTFEYAQRAIDAAPQLPWGYFQMGSLKFYAPPVFGGAKDVSLKYFLEAKARFINIPNYQNYYQYPSLLRAIAQNYEALENYQEALKYYNEILSLYPDFAWVKDTLRPNLLKKMGEYLLRAKSK